MSDLEEHRERIRGWVSGIGKTARWIAQHLDYAESDWCLIWPFFYEEGAYPKFHNPRRAVHRIMCEYRNGPPPSPSHHSAHSCDKGRQGCCNPMHVSWKTPSENQLDRRREGERPRFKINHEIAAEIRALEGLERPIDIANRYGITLRNVRFILAGKAWQNEPGKRGRRIFTPEEVIAIRSAPKSMETKELALQYPDARYDAVRRIRVGESYKWVLPEDAPGFELP